LSFEAEKLSLNRAALWGNHPAAPSIGETSLVAGNGRVAVSSIVGAIPDSWRISDVTVQVPSIAAGESVRLHSEDIAAGLVRTGATGGSSNVSLSLADVALSEAYISTDHTGSPALSVSVAVLCKPWR